MKITQALLDDWASPEGYSDFQDDRYKILPAGGGYFRVYNPDSKTVAIEANNDGWRGQTKTLPVWIKWEGPSLDLMAEPEFTLEEMAIAEEIIHHE